MFGTLLCTELNYYILSFLPETDIPAVLETNKELYSIVKYYNIPKKIPELRTQIQTLSYLEWCMKHNTFNKSNSMYSYVCILDYNLCILRYMYNNNFKFEKRAWHAAWLVEDFYIMKFLLRKNIYPDNHTYNLMVNTQCYEMLEFLLECINPYDFIFDYTELLHFNIKKDNLSNLELIISKFRRVTNKCLKFAIRYGAVNCFKYLVRWIAYDSPWEQNHHSILYFVNLKTKGYEYASRQDQYEIMRIIHEDDY